jgi:hypothetical protein
MYCKQMLDDLCGCASYLVASLGTGEAAISQRPTRTPTSASSRRPR